MANPGYLSETNLRKQSLKELAERLIERFEDHEDAPSLSAIQEAARQQVLAQLDANPNVGHAFVNRFNEDGTMVVTLAIRGVGTGELLIPADRFNQETLDDYGALFKCWEASP